MQTNKQIECGGELQKAGQKLLQAAHEYFEVYQKEVGSAAVVWLEDDNGHFVLFTRSEYKGNIMGVVHHNNQEPVLFEPFTVEKEIKGNLYHDAGAYGQCSYCSRYSDNPKVLGHRLECDCGRIKGWSGSFKKPDENSTWSP